MTEATEKSVTQHYEDLVSHLQITAIIDYTDYTNPVDGIVDDYRNAEIVGRIVCEYRNAGDKWKCRVRPCRIIFIFQDFRGEIAESVEVKDCTNLREYDEAVRELISLISKPLQERGIHISYHNEHPSLQNIEASFLNYNYGIMDVVY